VDGIQTLHWQTLRWNPWAVILQLPFTRLEVIRVKKFIFVMPKANGFLKKCQPCSPRPFNLLLPGADPKGRLGAAAPLEPDFSTKLLLASLKFITNL
jgi:hypothetical protein